MLTYCLCLAVIVTIGLPAALEHWANEQVLNFIHLMWEKSAQSSDEKSEERDIDPLHFLPDSNAGVGKAVGPLDATTVVEVASRAYASLGENGVEVFTKNSRTDSEFDSPLTVDAIIVESAATDERGTIACVNSLEEATRSETKTENETGDIAVMLTYTAKSFVATPAEPARATVPDPERKKRIVDWLCVNIKHLNELSQVPFDSGELWRLHQHYFTPVVNESGGSVGGHLQQSDEGVQRIVSSVPDVSRRNGSEGNAITPSTQSSEEQITVPLSDPSLPASPAGAMLKRKVSYRSLGDALIPPVRPPEPRQRDAPVAKMIEDGTIGQFMPPRHKRARRNKTRISFLPRIKVRKQNFVCLCFKQSHLTRFSL